MVDTTADYADCFEDLEAALQSKRGIRIPFTASGDAIQYRLKLYRARKSDRYANLELPPSHILYSKSVYDKLVMRVFEVEGETFLYIEHHTRGVAEEIKDGIERSSERDSSPVPREEARVKTREIITEEIPRRRL